MIMAVRPHSTWPATAADAIEAIADTISEEDENRCETRRETNSYSSP